MAYATGTATDHKDLLSIIKTFITTNATLVADGEDWTVDEFEQGHALSHLASDSDTDVAYAFDRDTSTRWYTSDNTATLMVKLDAAYAVSYFRFTAGSTTTGLPVAFDLQYSDDGNNWTTAQSYSAQSWQTYESKVFTTGVLVSETHVYWRVNITDGNGVGCGLIEMALFEFGDTTYDDDLAAEDVLIAHGPGLSGTEEIYVGIRTYSDAYADYFNFAVNCFTGYVASNNFNEQPGRKTDNIGVPLWDSSIPYYIRANGQQITVLAKVETVYMLLYAGKMLPYATPGQYPLPLVLCGMLTTDSATRYDDASVESQLVSALPIRFVDGSWNDVNTWPYYQHGHGTSLENEFYDNALRDADGTYPAVPPIVYDADGVYGELDGIYYSSGFSNAVENTMTIGGDTHIIWRNASETGFADYFSLELT